MIRAITIQRPWSRCIATTRTAPLTPADRHYGVHHGIQLGMQKTDIARRLQLTPEHVGRLASRPLPDGYDLAA